MRAGDFDKFDRIMPSAILDLFQDAAGQHAEEIGVGFGDMLARNYLWVLTRVKFKILSAPTRYGTVIVKTWPLPPNRFTYRREYCVEDLLGQKLIIGSSEWAIIDSKERRLVSDPDLYPFKDGFCEEVSFEGKLGKVHNFETDDEPYTINVGYSELDINGHVNNTKYANYVMNALNPEKDYVIDTFQIDYRKEIMQDTRLSVYCVKDKNVISTVGKRHDGEISFVCKIELKEEDI